MILQDHAPLYSSRCRGLSAGQIHWHPACVPWWWDSDAQARGIRGEREGAATGLTSESLSGESAGCEAHASIMKYDAIAWQGVALRAPLNQWCLARLKGDNLEPELTTEGRHVEHVL